MTLKVGSLFSGIEGIGLGLEQAGMRVVWQCEIDPACRRILDRHFPDVPTYPDVTELDVRRLANVDVLCGGFPCQDVSVAGRRAGLAGARSGLFHEFVRVADALTPAWLLIENVPGLLSSGHEPGCDNPKCGSCDPGADMATVVGTLGDLGYGWAYRILDAQYFGLAQRRRRVFIVGHSGGRADLAAKVLFEPESCEWDSPPSRTQGTRVAPVLAGGTDGRGYRLEADGSNITEAVTAKWAKGTGGPAGDEDQNLVVSCYSVTPESGQGADLVVRETDVSQSLTSDVLALGADRQPLIHEVHPLANRGRGLEVSDDDDTYFALRAGDGSSSRQPLIAYRKAQKAHDPDDCERWEEADTADTLPVHGTTTATAIIEGSDGVTEPPVMGSLQCTGGKPGQGCPAIRDGMTVRRLTPTECTRLQGFPDSWLEDDHADATKADAIEVLQRLWRAAGAEAGEGRRPGVASALLSPEVLLAGVHGGWLSWPVAVRCAAASRSLQGSVAWPEGFMCRLRETGQGRPSPYRRESFEQLARELGRSLSELPLEEAHAAEVLRGSGVWSDASAEWSVRSSRPADEAPRPRLALADSARYRALGNAVAVPVPRWLGGRIVAVHGE